MPTRFGAVFRRALGRGAVGSAARRLFRGFSIGAVRDFISGRFGVDDASDLSEIINRARLARTAADAISGSGTRERQPLDIIPVNEFLGGNITEGARVIHEVIVPWVGPGLEEQGEFFFRIPTEDVLTNEQIQQLADEFIDFIKREYPDKFPFGIDPTEIIAGPFRLPDVERRF